MSYTTDKQPQGILKNDETLLRKGLISEIVAITNIERKELFKLAREITIDEKEHVEELTRALVLLDKDSYGFIKFRKSSNSYKLNRHIQ